MNVVISARHMDVSPALKQFAETKAIKLQKYYDRIQEIEVVFDAGKDMMRVEMIVNAEHKQMFIAHHDQGDAYACIDECVGKLERQLSEHKKKHRNRKHPEESHKKTGI
ncbi:MAG: ribosome hibernation-promoting factor, HPF/YfiA family [Tepidisphaeraceae bacterium]